MENESKPKFKVGDIVAVYGISPNLEPFRLVATLTAIDESGYVYTDESKHPPRRAGDPDISMVHIKQCRKLKKTKRRRIIIKACDVPATLGIGFINVAVRKKIPNIPLDENWIEFVEVRRKK